ncbi:MAG: DUF4336 domain-containing protein [Streptococcus sp.]|nr:DUF4336 domain-containing protein [Streptococcus sp.]
MKNILKLYAPINELKEIGEDIWLVDGKEVQMDFKFFKVPFTTRMTIIRLSNNELWIHSPITLTEMLADQINRLGEVAYIVAPNKFHWSYIVDWHTHYPKAKLWLAKGVYKKLEKEKIRDYISLDSFSTEIWSGEILYTPFKGSIIMEEVVFFHKKSSTLILTDLIENIEVKKLPFKFKILFKLGDNQYPKAHTPRDLRLSFLFKKQAIESYKIIKQWKPEKIIFSHGKVILENGSEKLKQAFFWLEK